MNDFMNYDFNIEKILLACYVGKGMGSAVHKNRTGHGLAFKISGENIYRFDNGLQITLRPNEIIYLPKHSTFEVLSCGNGDCYAINFDFSEQIFFAPFAVKIKNDISVLKLFKTACTAWTQKQQGYVMECKGELYQIICNIQREYFSRYLSGDKLNMIKPAVQFIHNEYNKRPISIEELSLMCGITPEYFRRIFKTYYGTSPMKYINELKIALSKDLLASRMYSVTDAAMQSGYNDISYFSREFKKSIGVSPKEYIKLAENIL